MKKVFGCRAGKKLGDVPLFADGLQVDFLTRKARGLEVFSGGHDTHGGAIFADGYEPQPRPADTHDLNVGAIGAVTLGPVGTFPIVIDGDVSKGGWRFHGNFKSSPQDSAYAGRIHIVAGHDPAVFDFFGFDFEFDDFVSLGFDADNAAILKDTAPEFMGMIEKNRVKDAPIDMKGGLATLALKLGRPCRIFIRFAGNEGKVEKFRTGSPPQRRSELDGKAFFFDFRPSPHLFENAGTRGQQAFADMLAGKLFSLKNDHFKMWHVLAEETANGCSGWAPTNDGYVALHSIFLERLLYGSFWRWYPRSPSR